MSFLEKAWYRKAPWLLLLWPISVLFSAIATIRQKNLTARSSVKENPVPVVVVGNISTGGTGKTPFVIMLCGMLKDLGLKPGIISRGYGGRAANYPVAVDYDSEVEEVGDEALLLLEKTHCSVVVDPDRKRAMDHLLEIDGCDVVISDDGLQHYALAREIEIAIVDGQRLFGNGFCIPAGPLREPLSRLQSVNYVVINGEPAETVKELTSAAIMHLQPNYLVNLISGERRPFGGAPFNIGNRIQAVTGIGNPGRFHTLLAKLPYEIEPIEFPDHHQFKEGDFEKWGVDKIQPVVMTEKDAVKCRRFARPNFWYLSTELKLSDEFSNQLGKEIQKLAAR